MVGWMWIQKIGFSDVLFEKYAAVGVVSWEARPGELEYLMSELLELARYCLRPQRAGGGSMRVTSTLYQLIQSTIKVFNTCNIWSTKWINSKSKNYWMIPWDGTAEAKRLRYRQ